MTRRVLVIFICFMIGWVAALANPAYPGKISISHNNGKQLVLTHRGDEHYSYFTDEEGNTYTRDDKGGFREIGSDEVAQVWKARAAKAAARRTARAAACTRGFGEPGKAIVGQKKGLVILVQFPDNHFVTPNAKAVFDDYFNKEFYSDYGMSGSVRDYFIEQSYGQLTIDFDVVGPYTTAHEMAYYGGHSDSGANDKNPGDMIKEVCRSADGMVNFADYDWDHDGKVEQVYVIYAGYGENYDHSTNGKYADTIWPHEWELESATGSSIKLDGVVINTYACSSELRGTSGDVLSGIGPACHEFSHCLGLPDFYDLDGKHFGMSIWSVMDQGNYNNNSCTPAGYTSYERWFAGWLEPKEIKEMTTVKNMRPLSYSPEAYILYNELDRNEFYLLENRQLKGFDSALYGHGLLVLHVNYNRNRWRNNTVNSYDSLQMMTIIPADGTIGSKLATDLAGDPFPGIQNNTALTNNTTPAAILYHDNLDGQKLMSKSIEDITENKLGWISFVACRSESGAAAAGVASQVYKPDSSPLIYDLQGRCYGTDAGALKKGVYVIGGKKVIK